MNSQGFIFPARISSVSVIEKNLFVAFDSDILRLAHLKIQSLEVVML